MKVYVIYERGDDGSWSAYPPDLPGVGVVGRSREEARELIKGAIAMHVRGMRADGLPLPEAAGDFGELVEVSGA